MFEIEDLYELTLDGAFSSVEEFKDFANGSSTEDLFSVIQEGAFSSIEEFKESLTQKKKSNRYRFRWGRGSYGIYYRSGNNTWFFGCLRKKSNN
jgi:hypothetical protein